MVYIYTNDNVTVIRCIAVNAFCIGNHAAQFIL